MFVGAPDGDAEGHLETWAWSNGHWTRLPAGEVGPRLQKRFALVAESAEGGLLLTGGDHESDLSGEVWRLSSSGWESLSPTATPGVQPRSGHMMLLWIRAGLPARLQAPGCKIQHRRWPACSSANSIFYTWRWFPKRCRPRSVSVRARDPTALAPTMWRLMCAIASAESHAPLVPTDLSEGVRSNSNKGHGA